MTKKQEDKIIAQANRILQRRSKKTIHFHESGFCEGKTTITAYITTPNGDKAHYFNDGKLHVFSCAIQDYVTFDAKELPKQMLFSFRHGTFTFEVDYSLRNYKWKLEDLIYEVVDEQAWKREQRNIKRARKLIYTCFTIDDVYTVYDKYLRDVDIPYDIILKAFDILSDAPSSTFHDIMNYYGAKIKKHE